MSSLRTRKVPRTYVDLNIFPQISGKKVDATCAQHISEKPDRDLSLTMNRPGKREGKFTTRNALREVQNSYTHTLSPGGLNPTLLKKPKLKALPKYCGKMEAQFRSFK